MNAQRPSLSTSAAHRVRAEFSPLLRRATQQARVRVGASAHAGPREAEIRALALDPFASLPSGTADRRWRPTLIDRLQSPLTRYHD